MKTCSAPITIKSPPAQYNSRFILHENTIKIKLKTKDIIAKQIKKMSFKLSF